MKYFDRFDMTQDASTTDLSCVIEHFDALLYARNFKEIDEFLMGLDFSGMHAIWMTAILRSLYRAAPVLPSYQAAVQRASARLPKGSTLLQGLPIIARFKVWLR